MIFNLKSQQVAAGNLMMSAANATADTDSNPQSHLLALWIVSEKLSHHKIRQLAQANKENPHDRSVAVAPTSHCRSDSLLQLRREQAD